MGDVVVLVEGEGLVEGEKTALVDAMVGEVVSVETVSTVEAGMIGLAVVEEALVVAEEGLAVVGVWGGIIRAGILLLHRGTAAGVYEYEESWGNCTDMGERRQHVSGEHSVGVSAWDGTCIV